MDIHLLERLKDIVRSAGTTVRSAQDAAMGIREKSSHVDLVTLYDPMVQEFLHHGVIQGDEVDMRGFFADAHGGILRRTDRRARRADDVLQTFQKMDVHSFFAPDPAAAAAHFYGNTA